MNSWFISQGKNGSRILLLLPWNTAASLYARGDMAPDHLPELAELEQKFLDLEVTLLGSALPFDLGDEFVMEDEGSVRDGKFIVGQCAYDTVVLPWAEKLSDSTLKLLHKFTESAGIVFILGKSPFTQGTVLENKFQLLQHLSEYRPLEIESDTLASLLVNYSRQKNSGDELLFVFNTDCTQKHSVSLKKSAAILYSDGKMSAPGRTFEIPAGGALRLIFSEEEPEKKSARNFSVQYLPDNWHLERRDPNALVLEFVRFKRENDADWSVDLPILAVHEILTAEKYKGTVSLRFEIRAEAPFANTSLVLEEPGKFEIFLNGQSVPVNVSGFFRAREFETVPLPPLRQGTNILELKRFFEPLEKPARGVTELFQHLKGVELEAPFLIGDFAVRSLREFTRCPGVVRLNREFSLIPEPNTAADELTAGGYPFYAGKMILSQEFEANETANIFRLRFEHLNTAALKVRLNGVEQGIVYMPPYTCELQGVRQGKNLLELELFSSLRNLLGPSHRSNGEYGRCFGGYGHPNKNWIGAVDEYGKQYPQWPYNRSVDTPAWCESFMQVPFGFSGAVIEAIPQK